MALLTKANARRPRNFQKVDFILPSGDTARLKVPKGSDWRDYQASLRDKDGNPIDIRFRYGDELLVATILLDGDSDSLLFSVDDVLAGGFSDMPAADLSKLSEEAYRLYGRGGEVKLSEEDREKN